MAGAVMSAEYGLEPITVTIRAASNHVLTVIAVFLLNTRNMYGTLMRICMKQFNSQSLAFSKTSVTAWHG